MESSNRSNDSTNQNATTGALAGAAVGGVAGTGIAVYTGAAGAYGAAAAASGATWSAAAVTVGSVTSASVLLPVIVPIGGLMAVGAITGGILYTLFGGSRNAEEDSSSLDAKQEPDSLLHQKRW